MALSAVIFDLDDTLVEEEPTAQNSFCQVAVGSRFTTPPELGNRCEMPGVGKPDPTAFTEVISRMAVSPQDAVMVGDSWNRDIRGAVASGQSAVWIASGRPAPEMLKGVVLINSIKEVSDGLG
jgi:FMN phosphatase YigB (HAD superfamily)